VSSTTIEGFVASSDRFPQNGGLAIDRTSIERIADDIRRNGPPLLPHRGEALDLPVRLLDTDVRETPTGGLGVWVAMEVRGERWRRIDDVRLFSVVITTDVRKAGAAVDEPWIDVHADVQHFANRLIFEAFRRLKPHVKVGGGQLFQFVFPSLPRVLVQAHVPSTTAAAAEPLMEHVAAAAEVFLPSGGGEATQFVVVIHRRDDQRQKAIISGRGRAALAEALTAIPSRMAADGRDLLFFEEGIGWLC